MKITKTTAKKVLAVVDAGLVKGLGRPEPGHMCVEAAVCYAMGLPHGDDPSCVSPALRALKIRLNDAAWSSNAARAAGMRKLAILQLGTSEGFDEQEFTRRVALFTCNVIVADLFDTFSWGSEHAKALREAKDLTTARAAAYANANAAYAAYAAYANANAAAANAAAYAADAANAAANAAYAAYAAYANANAAAAAANAAAYAADAAAADAARNIARDKVLSIFAEGVAQILVSMGVAGGKWLGLLG